MKNPTAKYWRESHHARKDSADQLNDSLASNHSSLSSGYNRFKFQPKQPNEARATFQFTARNRHQPFDISTLTKRSDKAESRKSLDLQLPVHDHFRLDSFRDENSTPRVNPQPPRNSAIYHHGPRKAAQDVARQLKFLANSLKRAVGYFAQQLRDLRFEWDCSMKQLLKLHISFQNTSMSQLRQSLLQKQKEIQAIKHDLAGDSKLVQACKKQNQKEPFFKVRQVNSINDDQTLSKLAFSHISHISQVDSTKNNETEQLSRNNTLNSLLADCRRGSKAGGGENTQLLAVRQAVKRMREVLEPQK